MKNAKINEIKKLVRSFYIYVCLFDKNVTITLNSCVLFNQASS